MSDSIQGVFLSSTCTHVIPEKLQLFTVVFFFHFLGAEEAMENGGWESQLFRLVLDWARTNTNQANPTIDPLTEEVRDLASGIY